MAQARSTRYFARFARTALVGLFTLCVAVAVRGEHGAEACGCCEPTIGELSTFDPGVLGDPNLAGLEYNPFVAGYGEGCYDCAAKAMVEDWHGYLKDAVGDADWQKVLHEATGVELAAIDQRLAGKTTAAPPGFEHSSLWNVAGARGKLRGAVALVAIARRVEPSATFEGEWQESGGRKTVPPPQAALLADAKALVKLAADPFMAQRADFQVLRILFYQRDFNGVVAFYEKSAAALAAPSTDLQWRARYYFAGALSHTGKLARANLELARISANYSPLAGLATRDFRPKEDVDWHESLKLARDRREETELWRLVGVRYDALVAIQEILKLDPKSNLIGLLLLRELGRVESIVARAYNNPPDPKDVAAQRAGFATVERLALHIASLPGADRVWLMKLVAGHLAAKRGDLVAARPLLLDAVAGRPGDLIVASQAKASLAVALVMDWKINPQHEEELSRAMNGLSKDYGRLASVRNEVRGKLAKAYEQAGKYVDAEFLMPGTVDPIDENTGRPVHPSAKAKWTDVTFIKGMLARDAKLSSEFDRFVTDSTFTKPQLQQDLALRLMLDGDFAGAALTFQTTTATSRVLQTDPFVIHTIDCHDCDHEKFANAKWTHASFAEKLVDLQRAANGRGEPAAEAAFALGNALYNITHYGNARVVTETSHEATRDTRPAERWYKRAFDLSTNRELRAKAAFMAAKCELGMVYAAELDAPPPPANGPDPAPLLRISKTWYPIVKTFSNTKYYKEVLKECGYFRDWLP